MMKQVTETMKNDLGQEIVVFEESRPIYSIRVDGKFVYTSADPAEINNILHKLAAK